MGADDQSRENTLEFDIDNLNKALRVHGVHGDLVDADIRIDTHKHAQSMEAYVSQSDFGLVIDFEHTVRRELSFATAYLMQAKRLYPLDPHEDTTYGVTSTFTSVDQNQHLRMQALSTILGNDVMKYCLYCPPTCKYEPNSLEDVRAFHAENLEENLWSYINDFMFGVEHRAENLWSYIDDFTFGVALHDEIRQSGGVQTGMWIVDAATRPGNARDVHSDAFNRSLPLTWFLLNHFKKHHFEMVVHDGLGLMRDQNERVRQIACGNPDAIRRLINDLGPAARWVGLSPENLKVLPAATVTIQLSVRPEGIDKRPEPDFEPTP